MPRFAMTIIAWSAIPLAFPPVTVADPLPGTQPLEWEGDIASRLVDGVDRFLLRELDASVSRRARHWNRDFSSPQAYDASVAPNRRRLARILGVRDPRVPFDAPEMLATAERGALVGRGEDYEIHAVRWPVLEDPHPTRSTVTVYGEGLLITPTNAHAAGVDVVALPDADQTPEQLVGLAAGIAPARQFARRAARLGCRVIVPVLIDRTEQKRHGRANLTNREYLYRASFELGRHLVGYEAQKVLACVDWFQRDAGDADPNIAVMGYGEGAMIALYSAALDTRIDSVMISGYLSDRNAIWQQPIDRNVFGLLDEFGDAELLTLVFPRSYVIEAGGGPDVTLLGDGGAPARLEPTDPTVAVAEFERAAQSLRNRTFEPAPSNVMAHRDDVLAFDPIVTRALSNAGFRFDGRLPAFNDVPPQKTEVHLNVADRQKRQVDEIDLYNQLLLAESAYVRREFMNKIKTDSIEEYEESIEWYRDFFRNEVIGAFDHEKLPPNPRSRKAYDTDSWTGYEVVLDVFPDVIAYGILLVPKNIQSGERRPVVVCQHGLEGRPQDVVTGDHRAYHDYAAKLAERGFVTFAPQNLYIFRDRFRTLQRKANPLKKTLFSIIVPQHEQITDWLATLFFVDPDRIAFYGLSYGGKTAMRVPPLVERYCLAICSADFNEWVWKNASTRSPYSYVWTGEYEIFEFDLGSTFNYAEMAALIAPRPFMVERGHFDGVAPDEAVAYEFAKVRNLYAAKLGLADRCEIEWFVGPHTINGQGTFDFLHKHLQWREP